MNIVTAELRRFHLAMIKSGLATLVAALDLFFLVIIAIIHPQLVANRVSYFVICYPVILVGSFYAAPFTTKYIQRRDERRRNRS